MAKHVAIVGGGFSGAMLAVHLLRRADMRVTLIERAREPGRGLAYGAAHPIHVLNVRAANMSAYADDPEHLVRWLEAHGEPDAAASFAPRRRFGAYVREQFERAVAEAGPRLTILDDSVADLQAQADGAEIELASGGRLSADAAVLALGNLPPPPPAGLNPDQLPPNCYFGDPWVPGVVDGLGDEDVVLVVGTGLTMIDVALLLDEQDFGGRIVALSRRGLVPHAHASGPPPADKRSEPPLSLDSKLVGEVRERGRAIGWRHAIDELRPFTQDLWRSTGEVQRSRALRHLRPWWDIHRHRIAPAVRERIDAMAARGQLEVAAGKLVSAQAAPDGVVVTWRPRGATEHVQLTAARIINCTGPEGNLPRSPEPLLRRLLDRGAIRPGPCGIGIDVDREARAIGAHGRPNPSLLAMGPLTRGVLWEIVAVPDIRVQVAHVAGSLATGRA